MRGYTPFSKVYCQHNIDIDILIVDKMQFLLFNSHEVLFRLISNYYLYNFLWNIRYLYFIQNNFSIF